MTKRLLQEYRENLHDETNQQYRAKSEMVHKTTRIHWNVMAQQTSKQTSKQLDPRNEYKPQV